MIHPVVSPATPRETDGTYWGYTVRIADSFQNIWKECPFEDGHNYDLKIGTSFQGHTHSTEDIPTIVERYLKHKDANKNVPTPFHHCLIVFGGVDGLEDIVEADESLSIQRDETYTLFDLWAHPCYFPGTKSIRVEEAVLITLAQCRPLLFPLRPEEQKDSREMMGLNNNVNGAPLNKKDSQSNVPSNTTLNKDAEKPRLDMKAATFASDSEISDESSM